MKLAADGRTIENHVAGLPFPNIDPNDPNVALKIMFNYEYKPFVTDDQDLRNFDADTGTVSDKPLDVERHYILDHLRTLFYTGRLYVDPKPVLLPNTDGVRAKQSLHPILEPFDLKGVGLTGIRYLDPDRQDDTWLYLPTLRRVRRLSSAQRSDALFGQDTDVDSYGGYAGQIPWFTWKFLGSKKILGTFHAEKFPVEYCPGGADFVYCDNWEPRDVWVVEGTAKQAQYAYGKRVLFIDKEIVLHRVQRHLRQGRPALEGVDQPVRLPQQGGAGLRRQVRLRDAVHPQHHHGRHAAEPRDPRRAAQLEISRRTGLVLQPGREDRAHRGVLHHRPHDR